MRHKSSTLHAGASLGRKLLSILLALALSFQLLPGLAMAEDVRLPEVSYYLRSSTGQSTDVGAMGDGSQYNPFGSVLELTNAISNLQEQSKVTIYLMCDMTLNSSNNNLNFYHNTGHELILTSHREYVWENGQQVMSGPWTIKRGGGDTKYDNTNGGALITIQNGTLTLQDIILDGGALWKEGVTERIFDILKVDDSRRFKVTDQWGAESWKTIYNRTGGSLIEVTGSANLNIGEGAILRNNINNSGNDGSLGRGGAIYMEGSGVLTMSGGEITDNYAVGETTNNGGGGAIFIQNASNSDTATAPKMIMTGGTIRNNGSLQNGGAVYLNQNSGTNPPQFEMYGGSITGNTAYYTAVTTDKKVRFREGGGVFADQNVKVVLGSVNGQQPEILNNHAAYELEDNFYTKEPCNLQLDTGMLLIEDTLPSGAQKKIGITNTSWTAPDVLMKAGQGKTIPAQALDYLSLDYYNDELYELQIRTDADGNQILQRIGVVQDIYLSPDNTAGPWDGTKEHPFLFLEDNVRPGTKGYEGWMTKKYFSNGYARDEELRRKFLRECHFVVHVMKDIEVAALQSDLLSPVTVNPRGFQNMTVISDTNGDLTDNEGPFNVNNNVVQKEIADTLFSSSTLILDNITFKFDNSNDLGALYQRNGKEAKDAEFIRIGKKVEISGGPNKAIGWAFYFADEAAHKSTVFVMSGGKITDCGAAIEASETVLDIYPPKTGLQLYMNGGEITNNSKAGIMLNGKGQKSVFLGGMKENKTFTTVTGQDFSWGKDYQDTTTLGIHGNGTEKDMYGDWFIGELEETSFRWNYYSVIAEIGDLPPKSETNTIGVRIEGKNWKYEGSVSQLPEEYHQPFAVRTGGELDQTIEDYFYVLSDNFAIQRENNELFLVRSIKPKLLGKVTIPAQSKVLETLEADITQLDFNGADHDDSTLKYQWYRQTKAADLEAGTEAEYTAIPNATGKTYTTTAEDADKIVRVGVSNSKNDGTVYSNDCQVVKKEQVREPVNAQGTTTSSAVTVTNVQADQEYAILPKGEDKAGLQDSDWKSTGTTANIPFDGLDEGSEYVVYTRIKETDTEKAGKIVETEFKTKRKQTITGSDTITMKPNATLDLSALYETEAKNETGYKLTFAERGKDFACSAVITEAGLLESRGSLAGSTMTIKINSGAVGDYDAAAEKVVTLTISSKDAVTIDDIAVGNKTYDGVAVQAPVSSASMDGGKVDIPEDDWEYIWSKKQANGSYDEIGRGKENAPKDAGEYRLTVEVKATNTDYTGSASAEFTIEKRELTVTAKDFSIELGGEVPTLNPPVRDEHYTVSGLADGEENLLNSLTLTYQKEGVVAVPSSDSVGVYSIVPSGMNLAQMNYNVTYQPGKLTIGAQTIGSAVVVPIEGSITQTADGGLEIGSDGKAEVNNNIIVGPANVLPSGEVNIKPNGKVTLLGAGAGAGEPPVDVTVQTGPVTIPADNDAVKVGAGAEVEVGGAPLTGPATITPDGKIKYTVTISNGGSGASGAGLYEANAQVTVSAGTRSGYTFSGWTAEGIDLADTAQARVTFTMPAKDVTLSAEWISSGSSSSSSGSSTSYTLTFETNGGSRLPSVSRAKGTVIALGGYSTAKDGYVFSGWYSDKNLTNQVTSVKLNSGTTVYAKWEKVDVVQSALNTTDHFAYIVGYEDGLVGPNDNITRAETATIFYRLMTAERRDEVFTSVNSFTDVTPDMWYNKAVSSMAKGGYIKGYSNGSFGGGDCVTRAQFVAILVRLSGTEVLVGNDFSDVPDSYWAKNDIYTAAKKGWVNGTGDGTFDPERSLTRAEAIAMINRALGRGVNQNSELLNCRQWPDNDPSEWYYYDILEATSDHMYTGGRPSENWTSLKINYSYDRAKYEHP